MSILHSGDVLYLNVVSHTHRTKCPIYMSSEGYSDNSISGVLFIKGFNQKERASVYDPRDFLFKMVRKLNYAAAKDLKKQKKLHGEALSESTLQDLENKVFIEQNANKELVRKSESQPIRFGDRIQLLHVKSSKFVSVDKNHSARLSKGARRVQLIQHGDTSSVFKLVPAFKHQQVGDPIRQDDAVLCSSEKYGSAWGLNLDEFLYESSFKSGTLNTPKPRFSSKLTYEVNLSMDSPSGWLVRLACRQNSSMLAFADVFRFFNPNANGFLSCSCKDSLVTSYNQSQLQETPVKHVVKQASYPSTPSRARLASDMDNFPETPKSPSGKPLANSPCIRRLREGTTHYNDPANFSCKSLFMVLSNPHESVVQPPLFSLDKIDHFQSLVTMEEGGDGYLHPRCPWRMMTLEEDSQAFLPTFEPIPWDGEVCLFHLSSKMFLGYDPATGHLKLYDHCAQTKCEFSLRSVAGVAEIDEPISFDSSGRVKIFLAHKTSGFLHCARNITANSHFQGNERSSIRVVCSRIYNGQDAFCCLRASAEQIKPIDVGLSMRESLLDCTREMREAPKIQLMDEMKLAAPFVKTMRAALICIGKLSRLDFSAPDSAEGTMSLATAVLAKAQDLQSTPDTKVQTALRELKVIDSLVYATELIGDKYLSRETKVSYASKGILAHVKKKEQGTSVTTSSRNVNESIKAGTKIEAKMTKTCDLLGRKTLKVLFEALRLTFLGNRRNEDYIARNGWMQLIVEFLSFGVGAEEVYSTLCNENKNILLQIDTTVMEKCCNLIRELGPDYRFLNFFRNCCSCQGEGVSILQDLILRTMYDPGPYSKLEDKKRFGKSREELLVQFVVGQNPIAYVRAHADGALISANHENTKWMDGYPGRSPASTDKPNGNSSFYSSGWDRIINKVSPGKPSPLKDSSTKQSMDDKSRDIVDKIKKLTVESRKAHVQLGNRFFGSDLVEKGVPDIFVLWFSPAMDAKTGKTEDWHVGSKYLFNHPQLLGLECFSEVTDRNGNTIKASPGRAYVALVEIMWSLCPRQRYPCHKRRYRKLREKGPLGESIFDALQVLAKWIISQIELLGELSLGRSTNVNKCLLQEFPFDFFVAGLLDNRYPVELRSAFAKVCTNMYVDNILHVNLEPPLEVRVAADIPSLPYAREQPLCCPSVCCDGGKGEEDIELQVLENLKDNTGMGTARSNTSPKTRYHTPLNTTAASVERSLPITPLDRSTLDEPLLREDTDAGWSSPSRKSGGYDPHDPHTIPDLKDNDYLQSVYKGNVLNDISRRYLFPHYTMILKSHYFDADEDYAFDLGALISDGSVPRVNSPLKFKLLEYLIHCHFYKMSREKTQAQEPPFLDADETIQKELEDILRTIIEPVSLVERARVGGFGNVVPLNDPFSVTAPILPPLAKANTAASTQTMPRHSLPTSMLATGSVALRPGPQHAKLDSLRGERTALSENGPRAGKGKSARNAYSSGFWEAFSTGKNEFSFRKNIVATTTSSDALREFRMFMDQRKENELTINYLKMCHFMLQFGFFTTQEQIESLVFVLIRALDGRTDRVKTEYAAPKQRVRAPGDSGGSLVRGGSIESGGSAKRKGFHRKGSTNLGGSGALALSTTMALGNSARGTASGEAMSAGSFQRTQMGNSRDSSSLAVMAGEDMGYSHGSHHQGGNRCLNFNGARKSTSFCPGESGLGTSAKLTGGGCFPCCSADAISHRARRSGSISMSEAEDEDEIQSFGKERSEIRYELSDNALVMGTAKKLICDCLSETNNLIVDALMSRLLQIFLHFQDELFPESKVIDHRRSMSKQIVRDAVYADEAEIQYVPEHIVDRCLEELLSLDVFNYDQLSGLPLKTILLDLFLYQSGPPSGLMKSALSLLFCTSTRLSTVLENSAELQVLQSTKDRELYQYMRFQVHSLQSLAESFETWGRDSNLTRVNWSACYKCACILIQLRQLCSKRPDEGSNQSPKHRSYVRKTKHHVLTSCSPIRSPKNKAGMDFPTTGAPDAVKKFFQYIDWQTSMDSDQPDVVVQDIFRSLGLRRILLDWMTNSGSRNHDVDGAKDTGYYIHQCLMRLACKLLAQLVRDHEPNQNEAFEYMDRLQKLFSRNQGIELVVEQTLYNNQEITQKVSYDSLIGCIGDQITAEYPERNPGFLRVLQNLILVNGALMPLAKQKLLELLCNDRHEDILCKYVIEKAEITPKSPRSATSDLEKALQKEDDLERLILRFGWTKSECLDGVFQLCRAHENGGSASRVLYYREWLLLLGGISTGKDIVCETLVQSVLPGQHAVKQFLLVNDILYKKICARPLTDSQSVSRVWLCLQLKKAQLYFLDEAFCNSDVKSEQLLISKLMYECFDAIARDLEEMIVVAVGNVRGKSPLEPDAVAQTHRQVLISHSVLKKFHPSLENEYVDLLDICAHEYFSQCITFIHSYVVYATRPPQNRAELCQATVARVKGLLNVLSTSLFTSLLVKENLDTCAEKILISKSLSMGMDEPDEEKSILILPSQAIRPAAVKQRMEWLLSLAKSEMEDSSCSSSASSSSSACDSILRLMQGELQNEQKLYRLKRVLLHMQSATAWHSVKHRTIPKERILTWRFRSFVRALQSHQKVIDAMLFDEESIIDAIKSVSKLTDPNSKSYLAQKKRGETQETRLNTIHAQTVLQSLIEYGMKITREGTDWVGVKQIITILHGWLQRAIDSGVEGEVTRIQNRIGSVGGVTFVVCILDSSPPVEALLDALNLGVALLEGGNPHIQDLFMQYFDRQDDVRCFLTVKDCYTRVMGRLKRYKELKDKIMSQKVSVTSMNASAPTSTTDGVSKSPTLADPSVWQHYSTSPEDDSTAGLLCAYPKKSTKQLDNQGSYSLLRSCIQLGGSSSSTTRNRLTPTDSPFEHRPTLGKEFLVSERTTSKGVRFIKEKTSRKKAGKTLTHQASRRMDSMKYSVNCYDMGATTYAEGFLDSVEDADFEYIRTFQGFVELLVTCQKWLQLLCEGHNQYMQNYLRSQDDNSDSVDIVRQTSDLIIKLCKSEADVDVLDESSAKCLSQALELLVELVQGPCLQNQEQLATSGTVETLMTILKSKFQFLCVAENDDEEPTADAEENKNSALSAKRWFNGETNVEFATGKAVSTSTSHPHHYIPRPGFLKWSRQDEPETVRQIKRHCVTLLNAIVEARPDSHVTRSVGARLDGWVIKERIFYFFSCFLKRCNDYDLAQAIDELFYSAGRMSYAEEVKTQKRKESSSFQDAKATAHDLMFGHNSLKQLGKKLIQTLENVRKQNWELEFEDDIKLEEYLGEALSLMCLIKTMNELPDNMGLAGKDHMSDSTTVSGLGASGGLLQFRDIATPVPNPEFVDDKGLYMDDTAYYEAHLDHLIELIYGHAFSFFEENVAGIEVRLSGNIHKIYFVKPLACKFVLETTKRQLKQNVPTTNPQAKLKFFVDFVKNVHKECTFTKQLSRYKIFNWHVLHYFFKNDSKNLDSLTSQMLLQAFVLNMVLAFYLKVGHSLDRVQKLDIHEAQMYLDIKDVVDTLFDVEIHLPRSVAVWQFSPGAIVQFFGLTFLLVALLRLILNLLLFAPLIWDEEKATLLKKDDSGLSGHVGASRNSNRTRDKRTPRFGEQKNEEEQQNTKIIIDAAGNGTAVEPISKSAVAAAGSRRVGGGGIGGSRGEGGGSSSSGRGGASNGGGRGGSNMERDEEDEDSWFLMHWTFNLKWFFKLVLYEACPLFIAFLFSYWLGIGIEHAPWLSVFMVMNSLVLFVRHWKAQEREGDIIDNLIPLMVCTLVAGTFKEPLLRSAVLFLFAAIGYFGDEQHQYYYCFCLFDVFFTNEIMRNLMKAIVKPAKQLAYTVFMILIVIYTFGISAYFLFDESYLSFHLASDVVSFFFVTMYNIMMPGPALNIHNGAEFHERFAFNILFYGVIEVILMNIIFGIIIDTFGALRDETHTRQDHLCNKCFICNLHASHIDHAMAKLQSHIIESMGEPEHGKTQFGFQEHIATEHNMWSYMFFIFYILGKDPTTFTGPEQSIYLMIKNDDLAFFPIEEALCLQRAAEVAARRGERQDDDNEDIEGGMTSTSSLRKQIKELTEVVQELKDSHGPTGASYSSHHATVSGRHIRYAGYTANNNSDSGLLD